MIALIASVLLGACGVADTPAAGGPSVRDVAYAPADPPGTRGHLLDLYLPPGAEDVPLVVWTGGSAWFSDDGKSGAGRVAAQLLPRGFAVAGVSVRSSAQARFPGQVHDIKAAVRWLRAHAGEHGVDPDRIAVAGDSSGGWTALMAGVTGDDPELEGDLGVTGVSSRVQAVVDFYGPTAFDRIDDQMLPGACERFLGGIPGCHDGPASPESRLLGCTVPACPPERIAAADPRTHVGPDTPPIAIVHGERDRVVPVDQSRLLRDRLAAAGRPVRLYTVPRAGHTVAEVTDPRNGSTATWDELAGFLRSALGA